MGNPHNIPNLLDMEFKQVCLQIWGYNFNMIAIIHKGFAIVEKSNI